jgi:hypothetical protein
MIRNVVDVRGYCIGTLDAFDKHFNLVMINPLRDASLL